MRKDWEVKKLRDVCNIEYGFPFNSRLFVDDSTFMPLIRIRDLKTCSPVTFYTGEYDVNYIVHKGDYLIGMDGEFNIVEWKGDNGLLNQRICRIRSSVKELLNQFLLSYLPIPLKKIEDATPFVTVKHLSAAELNNIDIPVPSLQIQTQIVEELDCLISIIEKLKKQLEELDNLAQSMFYDMFGDPIANEKGWDLKRIEDICSVIGGSTPKTNKPEYWDGNNYWVTPAELNGKYISSTIRSITDEGVIAANLKLLPKGTVLFTSRAPIGKVAITRAPMFCNQGFKNFICSDFIINEYLYHVLLYNTEYLKSLGVGATFKEVSKSKISSVCISLPPLPLQQQFAAKIEAIEKQKELIKKSIKETEDLFNSRMDYYFN